MGRHFLATHFVLLGYFELLLLVYPAKHSAEECDTNEIAPPSWPAKERAIIASKFHEWEGPAPVNVREDYRYDSKNYRIDKASDNTICKSLTSFIAYTRRP